MRATHDVLVHCDDTYDAKRPCPMRQHIRRKASWSMAPMHATQSVSVHCDDAYDATRLGPRHRCMRRKAYPSIATMRTTQSVSARHDDTCDARRQTADAKRLSVILFTDVVAGGRVIDSLCP